MNNFKVWLYVALLLITACHSGPQDVNNVYKSFYARFDAYKHAEFDSLTTLHRQLDSVASIYASPELHFLVKSTEGRMHFRTDNYPAAINCYRAANAFVVNDTLHALNFMSIGICYMQKAIFDSAFLYFNKANDIYEQVGNKYMSRVVKANMAQTHYNKREPEKSLILINEILNSNPETNIRLNVLHIKANIFGSSGEIDSAMHLDLKVIQQYGQSSDQYLISSFYNNYGLCYLEKGNTDSALFYCRKSYQTDSIYGMKMNMGANLVLMGDILNSLQRKQEADACYQNALFVFREDNNSDKILWLYETLGKNARRELNLEKVLQYQDSSIAIGARINNRDVNRTIELLKIQYETESKNRQLEQQKSELQKQQLALIALVLTLLLIISVILLYLVNRNKIRQLRIANQNRKVSEMLMEAELKERERIARDLHDSVSQKLAVIQMHLSVGIEEDPDLFTRISSLLNESVADVRSISHNLFPRDLNKGIIPALEYLCEQCNFSCSQIHFSFKLSTAFEVRKIPSNLEFVIYRIVQELINNAIKHSKATNVDIVLEYDSARILLSISDNGIGFDSGLINKGKGIGLKNIMERIKKIGGNLELYSEVNEGTKFQIKIPY